MRLATAAAVGSVIGLNREVLHKPAGLRTHAIVSLGSALVTLCVVSISITPGGVVDANAVSRAIQGIVAGIGFLGGGAILKSTDRHAISGLTTAASIWLVASLGIACGLGFWRTSLIALALALLILVLGGPLEGFVRRKLTKGQLETPREDANGELRIEK